GAADVLDDPEISVRVVLDPLEAAAAEDAGHVVYDGREVKRGRPDAAVVEVLRREEEPLRKRVPGRAVEDRKVVAVAILGREERYRVRRARVGGARREVARHSPLVPLEEEVSAVVITRVGAPLVLQNEVGVLVRLGLGRLDVVRRRLNVAGSG